MKRLLSFIIAAILFSTLSYAQKVFGFKGGVQLTKMTGFQEVPKSLLTTLQLKGVAILPLTGAVTINPSLGYSGKGYRWKDLWFEDENGNLTGNPLGTADVIGLFHYAQLTVPLCYKIAPNQNQEYYLGAGPYFSYAVSGKAKIKHISLSGADETWNLFHSNGYRRTDAGLVVELSGRMKKKYLIALNADIGLADVRNGEGSKLKQRAIGISLGYLFNGK